MLRSVLLTAGAAGLIGAPGAHAATVQLFPVPSAGAGLSDIAAGPDGNLWFTEESAFKVGRITPGGQITEFSAARQNSIDDGGPSDIVDGGDGHLWFLNDVNAAVERISPATGQVEEMYYNLGNNGRHVSPFPGGGVWETLAQADDSGVRIVQSDGTVTNLPGDLPGGRAPIATAPDGSAWVGDGASALWHVFADGHQVSVPLPPQFVADDVRSIAFAPDGTPFYTQYYGGGFPLTPHGGRLGAIIGAQAVTTELGGDFLPVDLTLGPDGALWWGEKNGIGRRDPSGAIQHASLGAYYPDRIAFGADGALWFVDANANAVGRIALDGALFPAPGPAPGPAPAPAPAPVARKAPVATLKLSSQRLRTVLSRKALRFTARLAGPGKLSVRAAVPAATARRLHLTVPKGAKTATLARTTKTYKKAGTATVILKLGPKARSALRRARSSVKVTLTATTTASGTTPRTASRTLTLKR
jgi:streptogramin lyase